MRKFLNEFLQFKEFIEAGKKKKVQIIIRSYHTVSECNNRSAA